MQEHLDEFAARGVKVVAVSVDPPDVTRDHILQQGYSYTFLSDVDAEVIRRYDLLHEDGGGADMDIARPAEFLIDPNGIVRWVNLTENYRVRARSGHILKVMDDLLLVWQLWTNLPASPEK